MAMRTARWTAALVCALAIGAAASCHKPPSAETRSFYMGRAGLSDAGLLGCYNTDKSGRLTLFFGAPTTVGGAYGAKLWGAPDLSVGQIAERVKNVVRGFAYCRTNSSHRLLIGVGTSNSGIDGRSDAWLRGHGNAWAGMVRSLATWAERDYGGYARITAAWDFEPSWSSYGKAEQWMRGYDAHAGRRLLYANASADGCPTSSASNGPCNNGWNQHRVWHLAWEHDPSLPIPQIYRTDGLQARQWQLIDLWATTATGDGMYFYGTMTQHGACRQDGGCAGIDNTPHAGNDQLRQWLNSDRRTAQADVETMTDVNWHT
ncbi:MAG TPA: hypothetical protein VFZ77_02040 [Acidimicrobiales bacterium]